MCTTKTLDGVDVRVSRYSYLVSLLPARIVHDLGAPGVVEPFQHAHPQARAGQIGGRNEAVVAASDNYGVDLARLVAQLR